MRSVRAPERRGTKDILYLPPPLTLLPCDCPAALNNIRVQYSPVPNWLLGGALPLFAALRFPAVYGVWSSFTSCHPLRARGRRCGQHTTEKSARLRHVGAQPSCQGEGGRDGPYLSSRDPFGNQDAPVPDRRRAASRRVDLHHVSTVPRMGEVRSYVAYRKALRQQGSLAYGLMPRLFRYSPVV